MQNILNKQKYNFNIGNFEGPLNLLLFLITKNKMDIFEISLNELTDEYVKYLNEMSELNLEIASEFIVMAATLLDIKAKKLLPQIEPQEEEEEISEEEIISRIIEYKKYKEVAEQINEMYRLNFGTFSKSFEKIKFNKVIKYEGQNFNIQDIKDMYTSILQRNLNKINKKANELDRLAIYEKVTVQDKVSQIVSYLNNNNNTLVFNNLYNPLVCENIEVVTAFLGVLELSKLKQVDINQDYLFSDINVSKLNSNINIDLSGIMG